MRVLHVITGLGVGGAERALCRLVESPFGRETTNRVFSPAGGRDLMAQLQKAGATVEAYDLGPVGYFTRGAFLLRRIMREFRPDIVQSWMYHADLLAALATGKTPVVWGVRHANLEKRSTRRSTYMVAQLCARLSSQRPARILCNSSQAAKSHQALGYCGEKMQVIPNGFDVALFAPQAGSREKVREMLGLSEGTPLVGMVARCHPAKDPLTFIQSAAELRHSCEAAHFLLVGRGMDGENRELCHWIGQNGLEGKVHLLGERQDVPLILSGLDVAALSSSSESFPNVLGEAMACGTPCVTTDVGDAAEIVGDTGRVVPPRNPEALAAAWKQMLEMPEAERRELGARARQRIVERYSLDSVAQQYLEVYRDVLKKGK